MPKALATTFGGSPAVSLSMTLSRSVAVSHGIKFFQNVGTARKRVHTC